jgi:hypothetical protein
MDLMFDDDENIDELVRWEVLFLNFLGILLCSGFY